MAPSPVKSAALLLLTSALVSAVRFEKAPKHGAVASQNSVCSKIGTDLLQRGGNAVDAIIGTVFCVGTVSPYHSGIGGGGFMVVRTSKGEYEYVDFRETAPAAAFEDMFKDNVNGSIYGGLASAVPGEIRGLEYIHKRHGKLPWADLIAPSVELSRFGFIVTEDLAESMDSVARGEFLTEDPAWAIDFAPNGYRVQSGEIMRRRRYANTLESIAESGADAFYKGPIAEATINALQASNGTMTLKDLENYTVVPRQPIEIKYRGYKLTSSNVPSGGVVALSALNILSGYDGLGDRNRVNLTTHRIVEAMKFAYGQRNNLGDPAFVEGLSDYTKQMISPDTGATIRSRISDATTHDPSWYDPKGIVPRDTRGTSHMVAADASGMSVSLTTTVNLHFGSHLVVPETGIIMNNQMNDFSIPNANNSFGYVPNPANFIRPGKRPLSSISPIIAESPDGRLYLSIGAAGGSRITTATIQNVIHVLDQGMTVTEALAQPRLHTQLRPDTVTFEYSYDNSTVAFLKSLGHKANWVAPGQSFAQGVRLLSNGIFEAAGEPRQSGSGGFAV